MISIVMAYYNRLPQLRYTLKSIEFSKEKDIEIIIVDDFSDTDNSLDTINNEYPYLNIRVIKMSDIVDNKNYCNPCVPYNVGFRTSRGDKIVIQNPECSHQGDVLEYVNSHLTDQIYLTFHCWACNKDEVRVLHQGHPIPVGQENGKSRWYNHKTINPGALHFTSAITRKNLIELNGFDETFSMGFNYDDNEFLQRIKNKELNIEFVENPFVIHQYHRKSYGHPNNPEPTTDNEKLFQNTVVSKKIKAENKENICGI